MYDILAVKFNPTIKHVLTTGAAVTLQAGIVEAAEGAWQGCPVLTGRAGEEIVTKQTETAEATSGSEVHLL